MASKISGNLYYFIFFEIVKSLIIKTIWRLIVLKESSIKRNLLLSIKSFFRSVKRKPSAMNFLSYSIPTTQEKLILLVGLILIFRKTAKYMHKLMVLRISDCNFNIIFWRYTQKISSCIQFV